MCADGRPVRPNMGVALAPVVDEVVDIRSEKVAGLLNLLNLAPLCRQCPCHSFADPTSP